MVLEEFWLSLLWLLKNLMIPTDAHNLRALQEKNKCSSCWVLSLKSWLTHAKKRQVSDGKSCFFESTMHSTYRNFPLSTTSVPRAVLCHNRWKRQLTVSYFLEENDNPWYPPKKFVKPPKPPCNKSDRPHLSTRHPCLCNPKPIGGQLILPQQFQISFQKTRLKRWMTTLKGTNPRDSKSMGKSNLKKKTSELELYQQLQGCWVTYLRK